MFRHLPPYPVDLQFAVPRPDIRLHDFILSNSNSYSQTFVQGDFGDSNDRSMTLKQCDVFRKLVNPLRKPSGPS